MLKTLSILAVQGLLRRKRQTILILTILAVSFAFAVMMMSYSSSIVKTNTEYRYDTYGEWFGVIPDAQDGDLEYLKSAEYVKSIGTSVSIGEVVKYVKSSMPDASDTYERLSGMNNSFIGTVDDEMVKMGKISLSAGRLPKSYDEIAMESDVLASLGYDYTIGQTVTLGVLFYDEGAFSRSTSNVFIEMSYKLVGIIDEYTSIWSGNAYNNSAIITAEAADRIMALGYAAAEEKEYLSLNDDGEYIISTETEYYFAVESEYENSVESVQKELNSYLARSRVGLSVRTKTVGINTYVYGETSENEASMNANIVSAIFAITILAVIVVYILQIQQEIKRIVRMRSIGGTKGQLRLLIFLETIFTLIPSLIVGIALGSFGTWLLLRLSMFSGSVSVVVDIPLKLLLLSVGAWFFGVFIVRMFTLQIALSTPLTGRMGMSAKKAKRTAVVQRILIALISVVFCTAVVIMTMSSIEPLSYYTMYSKNFPYYEIYESVALEIYDEDFSLYDELMSIPGVSEVVMSNELHTAQISFDGSNYFGVNVLVIDDSDRWSDVIDFSKVDTD